MSLRSQTSRSLPNVLLPSNDLLKGDTQVLLKSSRSSQSLSRSSQSLPKFQIRVSSSKGTASSSDSDASVVFVSDSEAFNTIDVKNHTKNEKATETNKVSLDDIDFDFPQFDIFADFVDDGVLSFHSDSSAATTPRRARGNHYCSEGSDEDENVLENEQKSSFFCPTLDEKLMDGSIVRTCKTLEQAIAAGEAQPPLKIGCKTRQEAMLENGNLKIGCKTRQEAMVENVKIGGQTNNNFDAAFEAGQIVKACTASAEAQCLIFFSRLVKASLEKVYVNSALRTDLLNSMTTTTRLQNNFANRRIHSSRHFAYDPVNPGSSFLRQCASKSNSKDFSLVLKPFQFHKLCPYIQTTFSTNLHNSSKLRSSSAPSASAFRIWHPSRFGRHSTGSYRPVEIPAPGKKNNHNCFSTSKKSSLKLVDFQQVSVSTQQTALVPSSRAVRDLPRRLRQELAEVRQLLNACDVTCNELRLLALKLWGPGSSTAQFREGAKPVERKHALALLNYPFTHTLTNIATEKARILCHRRPQNSVDDIFLRGSPLVRELSLYKDLVVGTTCVSSHDVQLLEPECGMVGDQTPMHLSMLRDEEEEMTQMLKRERRNMKREDVRYWANGKRLSVNAPKKVRE